MMTMGHLLILVALGLPPLLIVSLFTDNALYALAAGASSILLLAWPVYRSLRITPVIIRLPPGIGKEETLESFMDSEGIKMVFTNGFIVVKGDWIDGGKERVFQYNKHFEVIVTYNSGEETVFRPWWPYFIVFRWRKMLAD